MIPALPKMALSNVNIKKKTEKTCWIPEILYLTMLVTA
jgi:hypothetical protein